MIEAARLTRELLEELGLEAFCKTSGGKGLHVVVPIAKQARLGRSEGLLAGRRAAHGEHAAEATSPRRWACRTGKGKIFIDYLRNNRGSSTVAAFSLRARPGMGASVPLDWDELDEVKSGDQWNIGNVHERLDSLARTRGRTTARSASA